MILIKKIYYIFLILSFVLSLFRQNRRDKILWIFPIILGLGILTQVVEDLFHFYNTKHVFIFHIYNILEYGIYAFYFYLLFEARRTRIFIMASVVLYMLFCIIYFSFYKNFWDDSFGLGTSVEAIFMIVFSLSFFYKLMVDDKYIDLLNYPHFYIQTANLMFFSISFISMSLDGYLKDSHPDLSEFALNINRYANLLMYFLYCVGFLCQIRKK